MNEKNDHIGIGKNGEDIATEYLKKNGYKIIERNFRRPWGEIDIIAREKDGTLVFVEVKTLKEKGDLMPEDNLTVAKSKKFKKIANAYANANPKLIKEKIGWRLDLISITLQSILTKDKKDYELKHWQNIA